MVDYTTRYGLEFNPFIKNAKEILTETKSSRETRFRLDRLRDTNGFGLLTGSPGIGKTTVVRSWSRELNPSRYKIVYNCLSTLTIAEFYRQFAASLGLEPSFYKTENFKAIQNEVNRLTIEKRQTPVFIIDEANHIRGEMLSELKMLFNFEMDSKDRAIVLLVGLPQLNQVLRRGVHESLRQRLIMNYDMEGLSKEEGREYITAKLRGAGCTQTVFEENALEAVLNSANGTPRLINKYCNNCLLFGNSRNADTISADIALMAVNDCELN